MKTKILACIILINAFLFSNSVFCAFKTKTTLLAEVDFNQLNATKSYFGVSDDNRNVFYESLDENKYTIYVNQKRLTENEIMGWRFPFSPDSKRTAVVCTDEEGRNIAEIDGKKVIIDGSISDVTFSPDSKNVAYTFYKDGLAGISLDGKNAKLYEMVSRPYFMKGTAGNRLVYTAKSDDKWCLVIDGKERNKYDGIREIVVSPDGTRLAIEALEGAKGFVVVDGKEGKRYDDIDQDDNSIVFSPDSKRLAYVAGKFGAEFVVVDDVEHKPYKFISSGKRTLIFSPDSKHLAYVAVIDDGKCAAVLDGKQQKVYKSVSTYSPPVFTADGKLAYIAMIDDGRECIVLDGKEQAEYEYISNLVFSDDGKKYAFIATRNNKGFVVFDGREYKDYEPAGLLTISPDGRHFAYASQEGDNYDERFVIIDGVACKEDGFIISDRSDRYRIIFDTSSKLHFIAQKDKKVYLVEKELE